MKQWVTVLTVVLSILGVATAAVASQLSAESLAEIRQASDAYAKAWLSNDAEAVMATLVEEPILSPSGLPYLEGQAAARAFWWPEGYPPTKVTVFEVEVLEVGGSGSLGYVRGTFTLGFDYDGSSYENQGKYLHLLQRSSEGEWRISHHLWNDLPKQDEEQR